jgi:divalent metal cation (Fe/Co/Zn/Cd) transporter
VSREIQLKDAHEIASQIEKKITGKISRVGEVFVHTEPVSL